MPESGYRTIKASSTYNGDRATHIASNLIDNDPKTNWTEGIDGNGEGEYIDIIFKKEEAVAGFEIMAGNHYNDSYYTKNSRPETIVLTFSDGSSQEFSLLDSRTKKTEYFNKVVYTTSIRVAIQSVYPGSDWEDTVISEFAVLVCDSVD